MCVSRDYRNSFSFSRRQTFNEDRHHIAGGEMPRETALRRAQSLNLKHDPYEGIRMWPLSGWPDIQSDKSTALWPTGLLLQEQSSVSSPTIMTEQQSLQTSQNSNSMLSDTRNSLHQMSISHVSVSKKDSSQSSSINLTKEVLVDPPGNVSQVAPEVDFIGNTIGKKITEKGASPQERDMRRLLELRERVKLLRQQVQGQRSLVQSKQLSKSSADEQYIKWIRTYHVTSEVSIINESQWKVLEDLWRSAQKARDEYGPIEEDLTKMEDRLEGEEAKLERAESRVYKQLSLTQTFSLGIGFQEAQDSKVEIASTDSSEGGSKDDSTDGSVEYEPIYEDYLTRLGDQDILQESYEELVNERAALLAEQQRRQRVSADLDAEDLRFLAESLGRIASVAQELEEVSKDVERLKQQCVEEGVSIADDEETEKETSGLEAEKVTDGDRKLPDSSTNSKLSELHSPTGNNEVVDSRTSIDYAFNRHTINSWLLQKLRSSSIESLVLANYVTARVDRKGMTGWANKAFSLWYCDDSITENLVSDAANQIR